MLEALDGLSSDVAISPWLRPTSYFRRSSSRIFRMDNLFCDTLFLLVSRNLWRGWKRVSLQQVLQCSYSLTPGVIGMLWNH